jgi:hypothetical protein
MRNRITTNQGPKDLFDGPNTCPYCHKSIVPLVLTGQINDGGDFGVPTMETFLACPNIDCRRTFIAYYNFYDEWQFNGEIAGGRMKGKDISESIVEISPSFSKIYNQAFIAEQIGLNEICGVGYRKAMEFLIKDYAKSKNPNDHENIEKKMLGPCINEYVTDARIQNVAKRAVWLGNDETHYIRKWESKDLEDLKKLVELTIHWIEMEILTNSLETDMPG